MKDLSEFQAKYEIKDKEEEEEGNVAQRSDSNHSNFRDFIIYTKSTMFQFSHCNH